MTLWPKPISSLYSIIWILFGVQVFLIVVIGICWIVDASQSDRDKAAKKEMEFVKLKNPSKGDTCYGTFNSKDGSSGC